MKKHFVFNVCLKRISILRISFLAVGILIGLHLIAANEAAAGMQDNNKVVKGIITDASNGVAMPGVSVLVKGTTKGTITDLDGKYSIEVSENDVLVFSFLGFLNEEVRVGSQTEINYNLSPDIIGLDEVVVIGYGVQQKKLSTGATVHVKDAEIDKMHSLRLEQAMQGLTPGVQVTANSGQPGEGLKVRVRGVGTINNADPLYIVDGVPTDDIRYLSPSDVESFDILKDAASAAIYGARAANGVILITTKKGKAGEMRVAYDGYYGIQNTPKKLDMLNAQEYMMIINEANRNVYPGDPDSFVPKFSQEQIDTAKTTNWQDYLFTKNAPTQNHTLTVSGGTERSNYLTSLSYFKQEGIVGGSEGKSSYDRVTIRINSEHKLYKEILKFGEHMVYSSSNVRGVGVGNIYNNTVRGFLNTSPTFPVYDTNYADGFGRSWAYPMEVNPVGSFYFNNLNRKKYDEIVGDVYAEIQIIKGLTFRTSYGIDLKYDEENQYKPIYQLTPQSYNNNSTAIQQLGRNFTYNFENYFSYNKSFGAHNVTALIGNTIQEYNRFWVRGEKDDLIIPDFEFAILNNGTNDETQLATGSKEETALVSFYGRLNYNYGEKYLFSATYRIDGSSKFGPDNRFGKFPSVSIGWVPTQENFLKFDWLDFFKIRASWGQNGNDKIRAFAYESLIQSTERDYYFGSGDIKFVGSSPNKIANPKIKWETSEQTDVGFDSRFLKNLSFNFDLYIKTTKDWLVDAPIPNVLGVEEAPTINGGIIKNKGVELALGYQKTFGEFSFGINANMAYNKNEVTEIKNTDSIVHGQASILFNGHTEFYRAEVGYPVGYFYGFKTDGVFQDTLEIQNYLFGDDMIQPNAKPGDVRFVDVNNDGIIDDLDKTMIGSPHPDVTYGVSFNAEYKGIDLSVTLQGVAGNEVIYGVRDMSRSYNNYSSDILDRWHGEGTSNDIPRVTPNNENYLRISDLYIEDGSYLKIRSVNIGYDFKKTFKKIPMQQCRIYFSALNLWTFTKYPGLDPEIGYGDYDNTRNDNFSTGIDIGYYPLPKTYLVGLNLTF